MNIVAVTGKLEENERKVGQHVEHDSSAFHLDGCPENDSSG